MKANFFKGAVILLGLGVTFLGNACGQESGTLGLSQYSQPSRGVGQVDDLDSPDTPSTPTPTTPTPTPTTPAPTGSTGPAPQDLSTSSNAVCETDGDWSSYLDNWISSHGTTNCARSKYCQNCCGDDNRFDRFIAKCFSLQPMDGATLGSKSAVVCEDTGLSYLYGFIAAKRSVGITSCQTLKAAMNACGAGGSMDTFYVQCDR